MAIDVIAWAETRAGNGLTGIIAAAGEKYYSTTGDSIRVGDRQKVIALAAFGTNCDEAQLQGNSFGNLSLGFKLGAGALGSVVNALMFRNGVPLKNGDLITGYQDNANNNEDSGIVAILQSDPVMGFPSGKEVHFKVDGAVTVTAITWTAVTVTLPSGLDPDKTYVITDMHVGGATMYAWRLIAPWGNTQRAGAGFFATTGTIPANRPKLPEPIGKFKGSESSITIEVLCADADTAQEIDITAAEV